MAGSERKRWRRVTVKPHQLVARYGRDEDGNLGICYGAGGRGNRPDARLLCYAIEQTVVHQSRTLREELESRGYDITTLRFTCDRRATPSDPERPDGRR